MNKAELAAYLEAQTKRYTEVYGGEIVTHAAKAPLDDLRRSHRARCRSTAPEAQPPKNLVKEGFDQYIEKLKDGTYRPEFQPSEDLWDERNW